MTVVVSIRFHLNEPLDVNQPVTADIIDVTLADPFAFNGKKYPKGTNIDDIAGLRQEMPVIDMKTILRMIGAGGTGVAVNGKRVDTDTIVVGGVDRKDYPDLVDAHSVSAEFVDGSVLSDDELEELDREHRELIYEIAHDSLFG